MTTITQDWLYSRLEDDNKYVASRKVTIGAGDTDEIVLNNPADNNLAYVSLVQVDANGETTVETTKNVSIDTSGSAVDIISARVNGETGGNSVTVEQGGTYSGGQQLALEYIPGSGSGTAKAGGTSTSATFLVEPGRAIRFSATNETTGDNETLFKLVWHEFESSP